MINACKNLSSNFKLQKKKIFTKKVQNKNFELKCNKMKFYNDKRNENVSEIKF